MTTDRIRKAIAEAAASAASQAIVSMYAVATDGDTIRAIQAADHIIEEIRALGAYGPACRLCPDYPCDAPRKSKAGKADKAEDKGWSFLGFDTAASNDVEDTAETEYMARWGASLDESAEAAHDVAAAE